MEKRKYFLVNEMRPMFKIITVFGFQQRVLESQAIREAEILDRYKQAIGRRLEHREMQSDTLIVIDRLRHQGETRAYFVYGTGGGKTLVAATDVSAL